MKTISILTIILCCGLVQAQHYKKVLFNFHNAFMEVNFPQSIYPSQSFQVGFGYAGETSTSATGGAVNAYCGNGGLDDCGFWDGWKSTTVFRDYKMWERKEGASDYTELFHVTGGQSQHSYIYTFSNAINSEVDLKFHYRKGESCGLKEITFEMNVEVNAGLTFRYNNGTVNPSLIYDATASYTYCVDDNTSYYIRDFLEAEHDNSTVWDNVVISGSSGISGSGENAVFIPAQAGEGIAVIEFDLFGVKYTLKVKVEPSIEIDDLGTIEIKRSEREVSKYNASGGTKEYVRLSGMLNPFYGADMSKNYFAAPYADYLKVENNIPYFDMGLALSQSNTGLVPITYHVKSGLCQDAQTLNFEVIDNSFTLSVKTDFPDTFCQSEEGIHLDNYFEVISGLDFNPVTGFNAQSHTYQITSMSGESTAGLLNDNYLIPEREGRYQITRTSTSVQGWVQQESTPEFVVLPSQTIGFVAHFPTEFCFVDTLDLTEYLYIRENNVDILLKDVSQDKLNRVTVKVYTQETMTLNLSNFSVGNSYPITFSYENENGCVSEVQTTFNIIDKASKEVAFDNIPDMCADGRTINLFDYLNGHSGGYFVGQGVSGNTLDVSQLSAGNTYTIHYYPNSGNECGIWDKDLQQYVNSLSVTFKTFNNETLAFSSSFPLTYCYVDTLDLKDYLLVGGISYHNLPDSLKTALFLVDGVETDTLNTSLLISGRSYTITAGYQGANGCTQTHSVTIQVEDKLSKQVTFDSLPTLCQSDAPIDLTDYVKNHTGGYFVGTGVSGNTFNPADVSGTVEIKYYAGSTTGCGFWGGSYGNEQSYLSASITVNEKPDITFQDFNTCFDVPVALTEKVNINDVNDINGMYEFTGDGIDSGTTLFNPRVAGLGTHYITLKYTNANGCFTTVVAKVEVTDLIPTNYSFAPMGEFCENDETPVNLRNYVNTDNGYFVGEGVNGDYWKPADCNSAGTVNITLVIESQANPNCLLEMYSSAYLQEVEDMTFYNLPVQCYNDTFVPLMNYVSVKGGTFIGQGVIGDTFYTQIAGLGTHTITYQNTNSAGCISEETQTIEVCQLYNPRLSWDSLPVFCVDGEDVFLESYIKYHSGGTFSGRGVKNGNTFSPSSAGKGKWTLYYTIDDENCSSCKRVIKTEVTVERAQGFAFTQIDPLCTKEPVDLSYYVNIKGGIFSGTGVSGHYFYPDSAGVGTHIIDYAISSSGGCSLGGFQYVEVTTLDSIDFDVSLRQINETEYVKFTPSVEADNYYWTFGDGGYSLLKEPYYYYHVPDYYDVSLKVWNNGDNCERVAVKEDYIRVEDVAGIHNQLYVSHKQTNSYVPIPTMADAYYLNEVLYVTGKKGQSVKIQIINTSGWILYSEVITIEQSPHVISDITFHEGIYFVMIDDKTYKILIND